MSVVCCGCHKNVFWTLYSYYLSLKKMFKKLSVLKVEAYVVCQYMSIIPRKIITKDIILYKRRYGVPVTLSFKDFVIITK